MVGANVVRDFSIGNTRIRIADNYCRKTSCEVERILQRIAAQAQRQFNAAASTGHYGREKDTQLPADFRDGHSGDNLLRGGGGHDGEQGGDNSIRL